VNGSRCYKVAWVPGKEEHFISAHADGNFYVYDKVRAFLWVDEKRGVVCIGQFYCVNSVGGLQL
jgi:hypothetical protein